MLVRPSVAALELAAWQAWLAGTDVPPEPAAPGAGH